MSLETLEYNHTHAQCRMEDWGGGDELKRQVMIREKMTSVNQTVNSCAARTVTNEVLRLTLTEGRLAQCPTIYCKLVVQNKRTCENHAVPVLSIPLV